MKQFDIICKRSWRRLLYCQESYNTPEFQSFFQNPDAYFQSHRIAVFKENPGDTTAVVRLRIAGSDFVVKRYNIKGIRHWLRRCLLPSKAMISWCNALRLFSVGIATPQPIAMIERRWGPLREVAFFITEYKEGVIANEFFKTNPPYLDEGAQVREAINHVTESLHAAGFTHDDWQFHNILLVDNQPMVLDLDHMRHFSQPSKAFEAAKARDWDRLRRSSESSVYSE
jgi:tRNA A-37 threonylcarbamoyl transferase component Bud32